MIYIIVTLGLQRNYSIPSHEDKLLFSHGLRKYVNMVKVINFV